MKGFLILSVFLIFAVTFSTCDELSAQGTEFDQVEEKSQVEQQPDDSASMKDEEAPAPIQQETQSELSEEEAGIASEEEELKGMDLPLSDSDLQENQNELESESVKSEEVVVHLTPGRKIVLTIGGGYGYGEGVTYTRWGRKGCRGTAQLVYSGMVGGGHYTQKGNGANYMCMPKNPTYLPTSRALGGTGVSYIYGAEYETANKVFGVNVHDKNVPCAVCFAPRKTSKLVMPARHRCPRGYTREYYGYLMSSYYNHPQNLEPACVDVNPQVLRGTQKNTNGILFYFMRVICGESFKCGPYVSTKAVTCAVCTR